MIVWLDHRIFGNGHGLKSPHCDDKYYWISGQFYTWIGGFGAQLRSFQWRHPKPGETRVLAGRKYRPFSSHRQFYWVWRKWIWGFPIPVGRVDVSWATSLPENLDKMNAELRQIEAELDRL